MSNVVPHTPEMAAEMLWGGAAWAASFPVDRWAVVMAGVDPGQSTRPALGRPCAWITARRSLTGAPTIRSNHCRFAHEGVLAVAWDGRVAPCLSLLHTHPEYVNGHWKTVRSHAVGHVDEHRW